MSTQGDGSVFTSTYCQTRSGFPPVTLRIISTKRNVCKSFSEQGKSSIRINQKLKGVKYKAMLSFVITKDEIVTSIARMVIPYTVEHYYKVE